MQEGSKGTHELIRVLRNGYEYALAFFAKLLLTFKPVASGF